RDCRARLRADPLRGQAHRPALAALAARARPVAAAPDDAAADARPARGLDPRSSRGARQGRSRNGGRTTSGGDGLMAAERTAQVTWQGDLMSGSGRIDSVG